MLNSKYNSAGWIRKTDNPNFAIFVTLNHYDQTYKLQLQSVDGRLKSTVDNVLINDIETEITFLLSRIPVL